MLLHCLVSSTNNVRMSDQNTGMCAIGQHASLSRNNDRVTLLFDLSHAVYASRLEQERSVFYGLAKILLLTIEAKHGYSNTLHIDLLLVMTDTNARELQQTVLSALRCYFPFEFAAIYVVIEKATMRNDLNFPQQVSEALPNIVGKCGSEIYFHMGIMGSSDIVNSMLRSGFAIARIPSSLGGTWNIYGNDDINDLSRMQRNNKSMREQGDFISSNKRTRVNL
jgi:hypothetical protein